MMKGESWSKSVVNTCRVTETLPDALRVAHLWVHGCNLEANIYGGERTRLRHGQAFHGTEPDNQSVMGSEWFPASIFLTAVLVLAKPD